ncbi:uncharacterized protein N7496_005423 [Penicillium cataractarum]|uniref:Uncharacterized protein n=1 Tax=Penicillium cataractarum TaxID=2100454 RepID=A0A9W9SHX4_9EURO|nr:uncharacterized protein N7496_005423 [Penicillium cataractarum]KAJ5378014.1 hypothetical protein N7496_005423 [Penicillium cataractarum]
MSLLQDGSVHTVIDGHREAEGVEILSPIMLRDDDCYLRTRPQTALPNDTKMQVVFTILACSLASGIVFGFAALKPVLIEEGVFHDLCGDEDLRDDGHLCPEQDLKLNLFYTIGSTTANISSILAGGILDRLGSRSCNILGCINLFLGCGMMAISFHFSRYRWLFVGNFLLALGGTCIFVPSFQVANAFSQYSGRIFALITGAFDVSAAIFLIYHVAYRASYQSLTPCMFFLWFTAVPILLAIGFIGIIPKDGYGSGILPKNELGLTENRFEQIRPSQNETHHREEHYTGDRERCLLFRVRLGKWTKCLGTSKKKNQRAKNHDSQTHTGQVRGILHNLPARQQMTSPWFILITVMTILQMIRMNYFIATIRMQYAYLLDSTAQAKHINDFFDIALPLGGILSTPIIGYLLDNLRLERVLGFIVVSTTIIGVVNCVPSAGAGYVTVVLFVLLRPLYYSAMSDYAIKVFGFATFGRVYGTIICLSGLATFSQYGLDALTQGPFNGNPTPINAALALAGLVVGCALVGFVSIAGKRVSSEGAGGFSDEEEEQPLLADVPDERRGYMQ